LPDAEHPFLSGSSGTVTSRRAAARDVVMDLRLAPVLRRLDRDTAASPVRRVLVLGVDRPGGPGRMRAALEELGRSRHELTIAVAPDPGGRGKFENLNALLDAHPAAGHDWLLVLDDDVDLSPHFLDRFLFLAERVGLDLAQPAHRRRSHAAWEVTRRRPGSVVRETRFVEIGPVTALRATTFDVLLPFPPLRMGWGLDVHWGGLAPEHGWRLGVVDATPVAHRTAPVGATYDTDAAVQEAAAFLANRPYVDREQAQQTLRAHATW
jgi:hypothetical protein